MQLRFYHDLDEGSRTIISRSKCKVDRLKRKNSTELAENPVKDKACQNNVAPM